MEYNNDQNNMIQITFHEEEIDFPDSSEGIVSKNEIISDDSPASRGIYFGSA